MSQIPSKYSLEIYDPNGVLLADLTSRARNRRLVKSRNEADEISWVLDLDEFEAYCRAANQDPASVLATGRNEVRVKRGKSYLAGGQIIYWNVRRADRSKTIDIRAVGFLNLLSFRYTSAAYSATDGAAMARDLITTSQAQTNGNFGITLGDTASVGLWNKSFSRASLKEAIQELADSPTRGFDFEVTYDKVFNIYKAIGSDRSNEILFESPGSIIDWSLPNDATGLANEIIGIGSGNGSEVQSVYTGSANNSDIAAASQVNYALRQKFYQRSSVENSDGSLADMVTGQLNDWAFPFEVPQITVNGNRAPFITDYDIGDTIRVRLKDSDIAKHIDGAYRIERYDLAIDDNDDERITLALSV